MLRNLSGLPGLPIEELNRQVNELYAGCDCVHNANLPNLADDPDELAAMLAGMVRQVWKDKGLPEGTINRQVTAAFAKKLWSGVVEGYGKDLVSVDYETPDHRMLAKLQQNVWSFSAAKNYTQLRELGAALLDEKGKLRSYNQFQEAALKINDKYVKHHLKTEYNLAVAGGQMAGKWVTIQEQKDILPYLKFDAVLDKQTTALCRDLDETVLPVDHPFWKTFYPPNHFGCRSTVRQVSHGPATPYGKIPSADIPRMFQTNLGEAGLIFPPGHPFWEDLPESVFRLVAQILPYNSQFSKIENIGEGYVRWHSLLDTAASDFDVVLQVAREKATQGMKVDMLPTLQQDDFLRKIIFFDAKARKSPDLRINGKLWEIETATNAENFNNIKHSVSAGAKQADFVIVNLSADVNINTLRRAAKGRFIDYKKLNIIEFRYRGRYIEFKRSDTL